MWASSSRSMACMVATASSRGIFLEQVGELPFHSTSSTGGRASASLGMWIFLATEIMFFGGMFLGYSVYRSVYRDAYAEASRHLDVVLGGINTAVLLCSSLTMALAVHAAQLGGRRTVVLFLMATILLGAVFLGIKSYEYYHKYEEHLIPGHDFQFEGSNGRHAQIFF